MIVSYWSSISRLKKCVFLLCPWPRRLRKRCMSRAPRFSVYCAAASFWESSNEIKIRWLATILPNEAEFSPYRRQSILDQVFFGCAGRWFRFDLFISLFPRPFCAASRVWQQTPSSARYGNCVLRPFTSPGESPITATTQSQHRTRAATTAASEGNNNKQTISVQIYFESTSYRKQIDDQILDISYRPFPLRGSTWRL